MRCAEKKRSLKNGIPDEIEFQTKPRIALELIDRAKVHGIAVYCAFQKGPKRDLKTSFGFRIPCRPPLFRNLGTLIRKMDS